MKPGVLMGAKVVILGGGATGLAAAYELARLGPDSITVIEREPFVGGLAGTVRRENLRLDIGSHRIHPNYDPYAFKLIRELLGPELLERPRLGRILIGDRFVGYPPTPLEILGAFGPWRTARFALDYAVEAVRRRVSGDDFSNFETFLTRRVGRSLYRAFYRPYAQKLWALDPLKIVYEAGRNRAKKFEVAALVAGLKALLSRKKVSKVYHYPAGGIGQITDKFAEAIKNDAEIATGFTLNDFEIDEQNRIQTIEIRGQDGSLRQIEADIVVSTLPIETLHSKVHLHDEESVPPFRLKMRSLRILFLCIEDEIVGGSETVYIPSPEYRIGRVSQISRYSPGLNKMEKGTVLALEMICTEGDETWTMADDKLAVLATDELRRLGVIRPESKPYDQFSRFVKNLYPVYTHGWERSFREIYGRLDHVQNLFMIGRPALFLHCNIDHCISMAKSLADYLASGQPGKKKWTEIVKTFSEFQVKD